MKKFLKKSVIIASVAALAIPYAPSFAQSVDVSNISGNDRFSTAASIARSGWPSGTENVILVNSEAVADSLSIAPLASKINAPVLLTSRDTLNQTTAAEIKRLGAKNITIVGGEGSISTSVEEKLKMEGFTTDRISGQSRVETSINIAKKLEQLGISNFKNAFIVNGMTGLADAAGIGAIAAKYESPIIFTTKNGFVSTRENLEKMNIQKMYLIGGESSLPADFDGLSSDIERISGKDRQETNTNMINKFYPNFKVVYIADDGSKGSSKLIDSVLINAGIIASNNKKALKTKSITDDKNIESTVSEKNKETNKETNKIDNITLSKNNAEKPNDNSVELSAKVDENTQNNIKTAPTTETVGDSMESTENISPLKKDENNTGNSLDTNKPNNPVDNSKPVNPDNTTDANNPKVVEKPVEITDPAKNEASKLPEGPVMLVSADRGFDYSQLKILNGENSAVNKIVQVSGGNKFADMISRIADFIRDRGNKNADSTFKKILGYENVTIEYKVGNNSIYLKGDKILPMITARKSNNYNIVFDNAMVRAFLSGMTKYEYESSDKNNYAFWKNNDVIIANGNAKMSIDVDKEMNNLLKILSDGKSKDGVIPTLKKSEIPAKATNIGTKYVEIDISAQTMRLVDNFQTLLNTPVVTGNPNKGMATPPGIFKIFRKSRNVVLRGPGYASPVQYWMPFNGSIGIHDSSWQPSYGGKRYLYAGSHGCINTPLKNVAALYNMVKVGTPVIVHR